MQPPNQPTKQPNNQPRSTILLKKIIATQLAKTESNRGPV